MILVYAKSYLPYCHFEIENSDYLEANRRDNRLPLPAKFKIADPEARSKIRVVEFILMGVGICHTRFDLKPEFGNKPYLALFFKGTFPC